MPKIIRFLLFLQLFIPLCISAQEDAAKRRDREIPGACDQLIEHNGYTIGYSHKYKQALWICYTLDSNALNNPKVKRSNQFQPDPAITDKPVQPSDYIKTGYDRGHLAPAADMAYSETAMKESFYMSNISPQVPGCNRGIWKRLENQCRIFAKREQQILIVTGPVFQEKSSTMGPADIPVPSGFYKVILDLTPPMKMIGFIVPNQSKKNRIKTFSVPVDTVEKITGLDFFSTLPDDMEEQLESEADAAQWGLQ